MPRLPLSIPRARAFRSTVLPQHHRGSPSRPLSPSSSSSNKRTEPSTIADKSATPAHDSGTGWSGRQGRDHAIKRPPHDVQSEAAQQGMKDHEQGKESSDAISRKDEMNAQQKAKEEFPEAPVVIGMNDERGSK